MYFSIVRRSEEAFGERVKVKLCRVFNLCRSSVYKAEQSSKLRAAYDFKVLEEVKLLRRRQPQVGCRKLQQMLSLQVGRDRLFNILRGQGLLIKKKRSYQKTTNSRHWFYKHKNLIKGVLPQSSGEQYVSDITYIETEQGHKYLSLVTDRYSRKIVGYYLSQDLSSEGPIKALKMALRDGSRKENFIHHSDRGSQYCCWDYVDVVKQYGGRMSMTEEDHVYENALAERVNGILKQEFNLGSRISSYEEAKKLVKDSIQIYNTERLHMALGYKTPETVHQNL